MTLGDRIKNLIKENNLKQKQFAESLKVTESYVSKLIRGESGLSNSTAALIEEIYGYSKEWVQHGVEPKFVDKGKSKILSPIQKKILLDLEQMNEYELAAVMAFINSMSNYSNQSNEKETKE